MRPALLSALLLSCSAPEEGEATRLVRLTATQWERAAADLLGLDDLPGLADDFVPDPASGVFDNNGAELRVSATLQQQYQDAAIALAQGSVIDRDRYSAILGSDLPPRSSPIARDLWLSGFGRRAFRRPLTGLELQRFRALFDTGPALFDQQDEFAAGVQLSTAAFLQSPHFLYRVDRADGAELGPLSLATKLSFALWNAPPDEVLLSTAEAADGAEPVLADVPRMLADARARDMVHDLHWQLLHIDSYANIPREFVSYEDYESTLNAAMQAEVAAFVDAVVFSGGTVADLLTSRESFVDAQVAELYELDGVARSGAHVQAPVQLPEGERAGLLTLSGFLAVHSSPTSENLIRRSAFVHEALMCTHLPPPPPEATALPDAGSAVGTRARIEALTGECGGACHQDLLNPLAYAFGQYDRMGRFRDDPDIDTTSAFTFSFGRRSFDGAVELAALLAEDADVHRCYASRLLSYLEGRTLDADDSARVEALADASMSGAPILGLITEIVVDPAFRRVR